MSHAWGCSIAIICKSSYNHGYSSRKISLIKDFLDFFSIFIESSSAFDCSFDNIRGYSCFACVCESICKCMIDIWIRSAFSSNSDQFWVDSINFSFCFRWGFFLSSYGRSASHIIKVLWEINLIKNIKNIKNIFLFMHLFVFLKNRSTPGSQLLQ